MAFAYRILERSEDDEDQFDIHEHVGGFASYIDAQVAALRAIQKLDQPVPQYHLEQKVWVLRDGAYIPYSPRMEEVQEVRRLLQSPAKG